MKGHLCGLACVLALVATSPAAAQHHGSAEEPAVRLYDNLGPFQRPITTASADAQQYFNQGMRLAFAFGRREAAASFKMAQQHDPDCAMCYWGKAWALGPYINEPMYDEAVPRAYESIQTARDLAGGASDVEKDLIEAMAARYAATPEAADRPALDSAYADAMRDVVRRYPHDLDAGALFGEALMVLRPWDHWTSEGLPQPGTEEAVAVLESVLGRDIKHAGACHLYIHLVEASPAPERAEACADYLADGIPGASHIQHMPSHIYMNIGRYGDSVRANQRALRMDQRAREGQAVAIYPEHNLHMLVFAGWMDGQSAVAIQAARDLAKISSADAFNPILLLTRFGRWDEVLALAARPDERLEEGLWSFARGMAHLRLARQDSAAWYRNRLASITADTPDSLTYGFFGHRQADLLQMASGILNGELAAAEGRFEDAMRELEQAMVLEDNLTYDEPEPWPLPVRHVLGAIQLEAGRPRMAEQTYRDALLDHPMNGWSLYGLAQSLEAQGKSAEAAAVRADFEEAWSRADVWLKSSRF